MKITLQLAKIMKMLIDSNIVIYLNTSLKERFWKKTNKHVFIMEKLFY